MLELKRCAEVAVKLTEIAAALGAHAALRRWSHLERRGGMAEVLDDSLGGHEAQRREGQRRV